MTESLNIIVFINGNFMVDFNGIRVLLQKKQQRNETENAKIIAAQRRTYCQKLMGCEFSTL